MAKRVIPEVAEAFGADPDEIAEATEVQAPVVPVAAAPPVAAPVAPTTAITLTFEQLQTLLASKSSDSQSNGDLAAEIAKGIKNTRETPPQNQFAPDVSVFNPLGDRDHPRPGLKCRMTLGTQDPKSKQVSETYPFEEDDLTAYEQIALNTLQPWSGVVKRLDGAPMKVSLVPTYNSISDELDLLVIVVPAGVTEKKSHVKNMLPPPLDLVQQITGKDYSKLSLDDLKWFMAEHRAKRYVSERQQVAA